MTVLVTGATAGFGLATVRKFAKDGAKVIGTGRRADRLADLAKEIGPNFLPLTFDVGSRPQAEKAIAALRAVNKPSDNLKDLRQEVLDVQKENRRLNKELTDLKNRVEASGTSKKNFSTRRGEP